MALQQLGENEAHLWYFCGDNALDPDLLRRCRELLTEEETAKADRCHFAKDRNLSLVARGMVRSLLSRYATVGPADWRFSSNQHGRPEISSPDLACDLRFNLSHTAGAVAVLISKDRKLGVDVEALDYKGPCLDIAERHFSLAEVEMLRALPASEQVPRFVETWSLKEAFVKAHGIGLSMSLDGFSFQISSDSERTIEVQFSPRMNDDPARWDFTLDTIDQKFAVATAIGKSEGESLQLLRRQVTTEEALSDS